MRNNLGVKTSRAEISTSIDGDAAVRTLGLGQRAMAEHQLEASRRCVADIRMSTYDKRI
jgi:hypothetical protein